MMNSNPIVMAGYFQLQVPRYRLWLSVGCTPAERQVPQPIDLDVSVTLSRPPEGATTDCLEDTFCYDTLLGELRVACQAKSFCLLEHLAERLCNTTQQFLTHKGFSTHVCRIGVTKVSPPVPGVLEGVRVVLQTGRLP